MYYGGSSDSYSSFEPRKKKKTVGKRQKVKYSEDEECNKRALIKKINKIFKKSYESKQILEDEQLKGLFKNIYQKVLEEMEVPEGELKALEKEAEQGAEVGERRVLTNDGTDEDTKRNLKLLDYEIHTINGQYGPVDSYINCDLRYFNLDFLVEKIGSFDGRIE